MEFINLCLYYIILFRYLMFIEICNSSIAVKSFGFKGLKEINELQDNGTVPHRPSILI